jgi:hypothetical protein
VPRVLDVGGEVRGGAEVQRDGVVGRNAGTAGQAESLAYVAIGYGGNFTQQLAECGIEGGDVFRADTLPELEQQDVA